MDWQTLRVWHAVPTLLLTGLIWCVQIVHYPLFAAVGTAGFAAYERAHCRRIAWLVVPTMLAEVALATWLCRAAPPPQALLAGIGAALLTVVWGSTFLLQVPCHDRLARGFDAAVVRRLVASNWLRTAAWTARSAVAIALLRT